MAERVLLTYAQIVGLFLSPSMYQSWKCFVTSSQASKLRQSETMNYQLSAVYSVELLAYPKKS